MGQTSDMIKLAKTKREIKLFAPVLSFTLGMCVRYLCFCWVGDLIKQIYVLFQSYITFERPNSLPQNLASRKQCLE
jgi:hypothetical protein